MAAQAKSSRTAPKKNAHTRKARWDDATKAKAKALLLSGERIEAISQQLGVPNSTVDDWARDIGGIEALREGRLGDLMYSYLEENLTTLAAQSRFARDPEWLEKQEADKLAILHGVIADKTTGVLAAIERACALPERGADRTGAAAPA